MKYTTGLAALLCALPLSVAVAGSSGGYSTKNDVHSYTQGSTTFPATENAAQGGSHQYGTNTGSSGYGVAKDAHSYTQGSNNAGLIQPSTNRERTQSFGQEQRSNEYGPNAAYSRANGWGSQNSAMTASGTVRNVQQALAQAGADVPTDGRMGPQTERAILNYQSLHHLPLTGRLDQQTLQSLNIS